MDNLETPRRERDSFVRDGFGSSKSGKAFPEAGHPRTFHPISLGGENDFACHWI